MERWKIMRVMGATRVGMGDPPPIWAPRGRGVLDPRVRSSWLEVC